MCHLRATRQNHDNKPEAVLYMNNYLTRCGRLGTEALSRPIGGTQEHTIPLIATNFDLSDDNRHGRQSRHAARPMNVCNEETTR
jgi:hypothetical protein